MGKEWVNHKSTEPQKHEGFQFGTNPDHMTPFERNAVLKERVERERAKQKYILGIQGVDGGKCY